MAIAATPASGTSTSRVSSGNVIYLRAPLATLSTPQVVPDDHDSPEEHGHRIGAHRSRLNLPNQAAGLDDDLSSAVHGAVDYARVRLPQHVLGQRFQGLD